jgi:(2S)-methylsuccinyl-CoA dehydrogenase
MTDQDPLLPDLIPLCARALDAAERLTDRARDALSTAQARGPADQTATHGFAWFATTTAALREMLGWARGLPTASEVERLILQAVYAEYLNQLAGGVPMSQVETARPRDLGIAEDDVARFEGDEAVRALRRAGTPDLRARLAIHLAEGRFGDPGLGDETLALMRGEIRRFADDQGDAPHRWHLADALIPDEVVERLAALGVFGLTIPEEYGGLGLGKLAMCVVTEELSRGYLGLGSLGTRSEIAAELIRANGTEAQRRRWLPGIAAGRILPTAVFTEPEAGSDLGSLRTRATREGGVWTVRGSKTWITHAARSDLMTLLVRTDPDAPGHRGLSMLIAEKPRGTEGDPFPAPGMTGGEIPVLGYRGMKEYELAFDGFEVPDDGLLGGVEGQGFRQLMETFESARIQTAARAVGVAQNALELGLGYAAGRRQFGRPILDFARVGGKLAWMAAETMAARQLTLHAARRKDEGVRCDVEAGMAKLLAARVAWASADAALQVHGGNGYALEYPISRVLCDARILNVFEGAAEIQAEVIARGLLTRRN